MNTAHLLKAYRKTINPPYWGKDLLVVALTLIILAAIPLTVIGLRVGRGGEPQIRAYTNPTLYLSPATQSVNQNNNFDVQIREDSQTQTINAVQSNITYDANKLDCVSSTPNSAVFNMTVENTCANGSVRVVVGKTPPPVTGDQLVATVTFKAKTSPGSTTVSFAAGSAIVRSPDSVNILADKIGGTYTILELPPTVDIKVNSSDGPITIAYNTAATISWTSANATSCSVTPGGWAGLYNSGVSTGNLTTTTTYTSTCNGAGGTRTDSVTVNVSPRPTVSISAYPASITSGQSSTISWTSSNATSVAITPDIGTVGTSGSRVVKPSSSITYTAVAYGPGSSSNPASASVTVNGVPPPPPPLSPKMPGQQPSGSSLGGALTSLQITISVPYLVGKMKIPVAIGSVAREIEISPDKTEYSVDVKGANISIGSSLTIVIGGNKTLVKKIQIVPASTSTTANVGGLVLGDITGDDKIDEADSLALLNSITNQTLRGDLNADGSTNSLDWAVLLANFGKQGDL